MTNPRNTAPGMTGRRITLFLAGGAVLAIALSSAAAQAAPSPFGVGLPEQSLPSGGMLSGFFAWVSAQQTAFYGALTSALKQMKADGTAGWWLMGLSFLYGVFHAAGPVSYTHLHHHHHHHCYYGYCWCCCCCCCYYYYYYDDDEYY